MEKVENLCRTARLQNVSIHTSGQFGSRLRDACAAAGMREAQAALNAQTVDSATPDARLQVQRRLRKRIDALLTAIALGAICLRRGDISQARELAEYESFALGTLGILRWRRGGRRKFCPFCAKLLAMQRHAA